MKIAIKGPIISDGDQRVYDWFGIPATSPDKVSKTIDSAIRNNVNELTVVINSGGGSVFSASEIYTELKKFSGKVKVEIVGVAASAASVIAMAGSTIEMSPTGQLMIHNASTSTWGDYREMDHTSDFLQKVNQSIMNAYTVKTGKRSDELKMLMDAETWMTAQEAKESGFIDSIMFENEVGAVASTERPELINGVLPQEVINKVREQLANDKTTAVVNSATQQNKKDESEVKSKMTIEELKAQNPDLYNQVFNLGKEDGVSAERKRIQEIEDISSPGNEEIINKAKFETGATAADTAMEILKAQKEKGAQMQNAIRKDAANLGNITPTPEATPAAGETVEDFADNLLNSMGMGGK
ncbi:hypothetical protein SLU01_19320 [Sporosarcina luteola]|uniref:ATP-dependent Clp protease proteolytic subunit n=1 Tax=Sporosarcina luteola TaxID=582850 RepID=A0A511Z854_9BACL|nr:head maturation protease, ClpP-related [Sporosarcina luteola]GEN83620.1 hypothetical protein SLU01_19320 [Sporosarcina luteola]